METGGNFISAGADTEMNGSTCPDSSESTLWDTSTYFGTKTP